MQVTYTTTREDILTCNRHFLWKSPRARKTFLIFWLGPAFILVTIGVILVVENRRPLGWALGALGLLHLAFYPLFHQTYLGSLVRASLKDLDMRGVVGQCTLILTAESLVDISETTRTEVRWTDCPGVEIVGEYTFIYVTSMLVVILPRHGFASDTEYETVRDYAVNCVGVDRTKRWS